MPSVGENFPGSIFPDRENQGQSMTCDRISLRYGLKLKRSHGLGFGGFWSFIIWNFAGDFIQYFKT